MILILLFLLFQLIFAKETSEKRNETEGSTDFKNIDRKHGNYVSDRSTHTTHHYSNNKFERINNSIIINENYDEDEIYDSHFSDPSLPNDQDYLFIVQKKMTFENIQFNFTSAASNNIGAINIEYDGEVNIRNCTFIGCSSKNAKCSTIYISSIPQRINAKEETGPKIFESNIFTNCGRANSYVVEITFAISSFIFQDQLFEFDNIEDACGAIYLGVTGSFSIINSTFRGTKADGSVLYKHDNIANQEDYFIIESCIFENCIGLTIKIDLPSSSPETVNLTNCRFSSCSSSSLSNVIGTSLTSDSFEFNIENCTFSNCGTENYVIYLDIQSCPTDSCPPIRFIDNVIEFTELNEAAMGIYVCQENRTFLIQKSRFIHCRSRDTVPWASSFYAFKALSAIFEDCVVLDGSSHNCIVFGESVENSVAKNNTFEYLVLRGGGSISAYSANVIIVNNTFIKCGVQITIFALDKGLELCELVDNHYLNCYSGIIDLRIYTKVGEPTLIIKRNVFENHQVSFHSVAFKFENSYYKDVQIQNNVFKNFQGILTNLDEENLTFSFLNCSFVDFSDLGGNIFVFRHEHLKLIFKDCLFERNFIESNNVILSFEMNNETIFENCSFINNSGLNTILINQYNEVSFPVTVLNCSFSNNKCSSKSAIFYAKSFLVDLSIDNCTFSDNSAGDTGSIISVMKETDQSEYQQKISINNCLFLSNNYSNCLVVSNPESKFEITNCNFLNDTQKESQCVLSHSPEFLFENSTIDSKGSSLKFSSSARILNVLSSNFLNNKGGISISGLFTTANIENCIFSDCYVDGIAAVISISNRECFFNNNIVNFSSSDRYKSMGGMTITSQGNIIVTNNQFIRIRKIKYGGIEIIDDYYNFPDGLVVFNYNVIEEAANGQNGVFFISKKYDFNIDSNIINNCRISDFSNTIYLYNSMFYNHSFTLTNLTLSGCSSVCNTGGGFGLWLVFQTNNEGVKKGMFTMQDCLFENNTSNVSDTKEDCGNGGAFSLGLIPGAQTELIINNCSFIGNYAERNGGALSFKLSLPVTIHNCSFIDNFALYAGGAIYIDPINSTEFQSNPKVAISQSIFIGNKESNLLYADGHAIAFALEPIDNTKLIIYDCQFIDNCNSKPLSYSIKVSSKEFNFENSTILFTDKNLSICGLAVQSTSIATIQSSTFINNGNYLEECGDIYITASDEMHITNNTFLNSSSKFGSIHKVYNSNLFILENCFFDNCSGCLRYEGEINSNASLIIRNCTFQNSSRFGENEYTTLYLGGTAKAPIVEHCVFLNCGHERIEYIASIYIILTDDIQYSDSFYFIDNEIIFDDFNESCGSLFLYLSNQFAACINNCSFTNSSRNEDSSSNPNCICVYVIKSLEITNCHFFGGTIIEYDYLYNHYYKEDKDAFVISIRNNYLKDASIINCTFDSTPGAIFSESNGLIIKWNEFKNTSIKTIYINYNDGPKPAEIIENHFYELHRGCIIYYCQDYTNHSNPIIRGNVFETITTPNIDNAFRYAHLYAFIFNVYGDNPLIFENNTFSDFNTQLGGFGGLIDYTETQFKLCFINCSFLNTSQRDQGGSAFKGSDIYNRGNCLVTFDSCYFNGNNGRSYGGCLYFISDLDVIVRNCTFINNAVDNFSYDSGMGGVIYIKTVNELTISDCLFESNHAPECQVFYCENTVLPSSIINCKFIDNVNDQTFNYYLMRPQYSFILLTNKIKLKDCVFQCTKDIFSYPILFKSTTNVSDVTFVNVTCNYSSLLYVPDYVGSESYLPNPTYAYMFNNFSFINCTGNCFVVELNHPYSELQNSLFQFSDDNDRKSGALVVNIFATTFILNNAFINANSVNGTIFFNNEFFSSDESNATIENCTFKRCFCRCFYLTSAYYNYANYYLTNCTFQQCSNSDEKCIICADEAVDAFRFVIDECYFVNCLDFKDGYLIKIDSTTSSYIKKPIVVSNCVFQFDAINKACSAIYVNHSIKEVYIQKSSFINCIMTNDNLLSANSICALNLRKLVVSECSFDHCGNEFGSKSGSVIGINGNTDIFIENCTFNSTSTAISSCTNNVSVIGNTFANVGQNVIQINHDFGTRGFELIENKFAGCTEGTIMSARISHEPAIKGNVFENVNLNQESINSESSHAFVIFINDNSSIIFENNSFIHITTPYGGFGGLFDSSTDSSIDINFIDCYFLNSSQKVSGGALQTAENFNQGNVNLAFKNCFFENNKANDNGGALYLSTKHDIVVDCCSFVSNVASIGNGGAIYISNEVNSNDGIQLISNCTFTSNKANDGFAIYIDGSYHSATIDITGNSFVDNYNKESSESASIISIEACTISREKIMKENSFSNQENGIELLVSEYSCNDPVEPPLDLSSGDGMQSSDQAESEGQNLSGSHSSDESAFLSSSDDSPFSSEEQLSSESSSDDSSYLSESDSFYPSEEYFTSSSIEESGQIPSGVFPPISAESESVYSDESSDSSEFHSESESAYSDESSDSSEIHSESESVYSDESSDSSEFHSESESVYSDESSDSSEFHSESESVYSDESSDSSEFHSESESVYSDESSDSSEFHSESESVYSDESSDSSEFHSESESVYSDESSDSSEFHSESESVYSDESSDSSEFHSESESVYSDESSDSSEFHSESESVYSDESSDSSEIHSESESVYSDESSDSSEFHSESESVYSDESSDSSEFHSESESVYSDESSDSSEFHSESESVYSDESSDSSEFHSESESVYSDESSDSSEFHSESESVYSDESSDSSEFHSESESVYSDESSDSSEFHSESESVYSDESSDSSEFHSESELRSSAGDVSSGGEQLESETSDFSSEKEAGSESLGSFESETSSDSESSLQSEESSLTASSEELEASDFSTGDSQSGSESSSSSLQEEGKSSAYSSNEDHEDPPSASIEIVSENPQPVPGDGTDLSDFSSASENANNVITGKAAGGISKGTLIGIICGVAAAVLVAVVAIVFVVMRKKKMGLNSNGSQSSILEDTGEKLQNDKSTTVKDDDEADLDFWL